MCPFSFTHRGQGGQDSSHFTGRKAKAREGVSGRPAPGTYLVNGRAPSKVLFPRHWHEMGLGQKSLRRSNRTSPSHQLIKAPAAWAISARAPGQLSITSPGRGLLYAGGPLANAHHIPFITPVNSCPASL